MREKVQAFRADIVEVDLPRMSAAMRAEARRLGVRLMIMAPEKDEEAFRRVLDWEADMVNLNHGDVFQRVARERRPPTA